jgi:hypothetical protein
MISTLQIASIERQCCDGSRARKQKKKNCRFDEIEAEYDAAIDEMSSLFREASQIRAVTLDGIKCKARLDRRDDCEDGLAASIADDLLALDEAVS